MLWPFKNSSLSPQGPILRQMDAPRWMPGGRRPAPVPPPAPAAWNPAWVPHASCRQRRGLSHPTLLSPLGDSGRPSRLSSLSGPVLGGATPLLLENAS